MDQTMGAAYSFGLDLGTHRSLMAVKAKGGRGIGNLVESGYLNGLSDFLFEHRAEWRGRPGMVARAVPQGEGENAHIAFELVPGSMGGDWR